MHYVTTKINFNLATMSGITVITLYVSVCVICENQLTYIIAQFCPMWMDCYNTAEIHLTPIWNA